MDNSFKTISEEIVAGYWDWNIPDNTLQMSARFKAIFGYKEEELEDSVEAWRSLILPADLKAIQAGIREHINSRGKIPFSREVRHRHKNGSIIWGNCMGQVVEWKGKAPLRMIGCHIKIVKPEIIDNDTKADLYEKANSLTGLGVWEWNLQDQWFYGNKAVFNLFEVKEASHFDEHTFEKFATDRETGKKVNEALTLAARTGEAFQVDYEIYTAAKRTIYIRINGQAEFEGGICLRVYGSVQDIGQYKKATNELQMVNHQFNTVFEQSAIGMALVNLEGRYLKVNKMLTGLLGYTEGELLQKRFQDITYHEDISADQGALVNFLDHTQNNFTTEKRYIKKDGTVFWILLNASLIKDHEGKPVHIVSQVEDISQRKNAESALLVTESKYRRIFENIQDVYYQTDSSGYVIEVSPSVEKLIGLSREKVIGRHVEEFFYNKQDRYILIMALKAGGKVTDYHLPLKDVLGRPLFTSANIQLLYDGSKNITGFEGSLRDVSERTKIEDELKERDALLTKFSEQIPGAIFQFQCFEEGASAIPFASKGLYDVYGIHPEEVKRDTSKIFQLIHHDDVDKVKSSIKQSYYNQARWELEFRVIIPFKGERWVRVVAQPQLTDDHSATWYGFTTDITDRKAKEQQLQHTFDIVTDQNNRLINFAYIISHNLRTHSGNFEVLIDLIFDTADEEDKLELLNHLKKVSGQLSETIVHLNDVVSIQTTIHQERSRVNLHKYVEKARDTLAMNINQSQAVVDNQVPSHFEIDYNPAYIESILFNFISNGIKYRQPGRPPVINVNCSNEDNRVVLNIEDNGRGIDLKKNGSSLFGMYKTFHGNNDAKGIGLFMTKNQVEAMGGKIEVSSEVNKGTHFKIYLS